MLPFMITCLSGFHLQYIFASCHQKVTICWRRLTFISWFGKGHLLEQGTHLILNLTTGKTATPEMRQLTRNFLRHYAFKKMMRYQYLCLTYWGGDPTSVRRHSCSSGQEISQSRTNRSSHLILILMVVVAVSVSWALKSECEGVDVSLKVGEEPIVKGWKDHF